MSPQFCLHAIHHSTKKRVFQLANPLLCDLSTSNQINPTSCPLDNFLYDLSRVKLLILQLDDPNALTGGAAVLLDDTWLERHGLLEAGAELFWRVVCQGILKANVHGRDLMQETIQKHKCCNTMINCSDSCCRVLDLSSSSIFKEPNHPHHPSLQYFRHLIFKSALQRASLAPIFSITSGDGHTCLPNFLMPRMPSSNFCWSPPSALICPAKAQWRNSVVANHR